MQSIIKSRSVRATDATSGHDAGGVPAVSSGRKARCQKSARFVRADERVHAIEITCSCGEVTVVELDYPQSPE
jgi:hypothetical protein